MLLSLSTVLAKELLLNLYNEIRSYDEKKLEMKVRYYNLAEEKGLYSF